MSRRNCWICKMCRDEPNRLPSNLTLEEVSEWAQSFENLMATKSCYGNVWSSVLSKVKKPRSQEAWLSNPTELDPIFDVINQENMTFLIISIWSGYLNSSGPVVYAAYLKMEHSEENIKFWMACETYKKIASRSSRISKAKKLYKIYIQPQSPREINIDSSTRETISRNIQEPTESCFEEAQKIVYRHMEMDSYPRFLKSEMYEKLLKTIQSNNS